MVTHDSMLHLLHFTWNIQLPFLLSRQTEHYLQTRSTPLQRKNDAFRHTWLTVKAYKTSQNKQEVEKKEQTNKQRIYTWTIFFSIKKTILLYGRMRCMDRLSGDTSLTQNFAGWHRRRPCDSTHLYIYIFISTYAILRCYHSVSCSEYFPLQDMTSRRIDTGRVSVSERKVMTFGAQSEFSRRKKEYHNAYIRHR